MTGMEIGLYGLAILATLFVGWSANNLVKRYHKKDEIEKLTIENTNLKEELKLKYATVIENGLAYYTNDNISKEVVCPICTAKYKSPIPINEVSNGKWWCATCKQGYTDRRIYSAPKPSIQKSINTYDKSYSYSTIYFPSTSFLKLFIHLLS